MKPIKQAELFERLHDGPGKIKHLRNPLRKIKPLTLPLAARLPFKILVARDNVINQKVTLHVLRQFGYQADLWRNGKQAVETMERQKYLVFHGRPDAGNMVVSCRPPHPCPPGARPNGPYCRLTANA